MRSPLLRMVRRSVRAAQNMVSQVVVSVAAAVSVGLITNAYLEREPASPAVPAVTASGQAAVETPARDSVQVIVEPAVDVQVAGLPPLATEVIDDLPVSDVNSGPSGAEIFPGVPAEGALAEALRNRLPAAEEKPERRRFLGLPLPYAAPTLESVAQAASAAGDKLVGLVDRR